MDGLLLEAGDERPPRPVVLDADGNEVGSASSWMRFESELNTLSVPAGGTWRLIGPFCATICPDRDIKLVPAAAGNKEDEPVERRPEQH